MPQSHIHLNTTLNNNLAIHKTVLIVSSFHVFLTVIRN